MYVTSIDCGKKQLCCAIMQNGNKRTQLMGDDYGQFKRRDLLI